MLTYWKPFFGWKSKFEVISSLQDWIEPPDIFKNLDWRGTFDAVVVLYCFITFLVVFSIFSFPSFSNKNRKQQEEGVKLVLKSLTPNKMLAFFLLLSWGHGILQCLTLKKQKSSPRKSRLPRQWGTGRVEEKWVCSFKMLKLSGKKNG